MEPTVGKKIYVVTEGEYSDYHICGVFSSRYHAQQAIKKLGGGLDVWVLDSVDPATFKLNIYSVIMTRNGNTEECTRLEFDWTSFGWAMETRIWKTVDGNLRTYVFAHDEKHAIKIMNERRVHAIADETP